ncbi:MAG: GDSL-type esterase/lipase family protein [Cytophagaceae bacterium]|nr:GDSL-type esterase/lipase family protein [Cytophagaceae bacterium]
MFWYEEEVQQLEQKVRAQPNQGTVFYGSSSIRLWTNLAQDFPQAQPLNLGFGGATLAACVWFFERIVLPAQPRFLVCYAGDNDLGDNRHPEEVYLFFCALAGKMQRYLPDVPLAYLSIKPSPARWAINDRIRFANSLIAREIRRIPHFQYIDLATPMLNGTGYPRRELYEADGLHLSRSGYALWQRVLQEQLAGLRS